MTAVPDQASRIPQEDERRLVTVVFADVVGFTTMGEDLDPEQLKNLIANCFERLAADVTGHGGRVDKIMGDELVAMFGAPVAYGDDAERAVRACPSDDPYRLGGTGGPRAAGGSQHGRGSGRADPPRRVHGHGRCGQCRQPPEGAGRAGGRRRGADDPCRHSRGNLLRAPWRT